MALQSRLFRGDDRLQACLVSDPAHLTPGSSGISVGKIQKALTVIDEAVIDAREMQARVYGPSTTAAVLRYKQARKIINTSYQKTADNIVGKMTIKSLDDEMSRIEASTSGSPICGDPGPAGDGAVRLKAPVGKRSFAFANEARRVGFSGRITTRINVACQITSEGEKAGGRRIADQVTAANELTEEMLIVDFPSLRDAKPFDFTMDLESTDEVDVFTLRKKAGKALELGRHQLRVIVHGFRPGSKEFGFTKSGFSSGEVFHPFIVLNARKQRADNLTLLHEMIHAAGIIRPHDSEAAELGSFDDDTSVFSYGGPSGKMRDHIRPVHLEAIRRAPWAEPFSF